jgi:coenzyme F420-0:L-glutamate ligase/coenzyme F420-1:gamma-L-glutamate ligase
MTGRQMTLAALGGLPLIAPGDALAPLLIAAAERAGLPFADGDVLVVAQKIVSKSEGRYVDLRGVSPSARAQELAARLGKDPRHIQVILSESAEIVRAERSVLIVETHHGIVMANAGVDQSNVSQEGGSERVLLLPRDPDGSAAALRAEIGRLTGADIAVLINDSVGRAWRQGVVGLAIGAAGFPSLVDRRGSPDMFGRPLEVTEIAMADELAAAASLLMGQADEASPAVLVRGFNRPKDVPDRPARDLIRPKEMDLFR